VVASRSYVRLLIAERPKWRAKYVLLNR